MTKEEFGIKYVEMKNALAELCEILCPQLYGAQANYAALVKRAKEAVAFEAQVFEEHGDEHYSRKITEPWDDGVGHTALVVGPRGATGSYIPDQSCPVTNINGKQIGTLDIRRESSPEPLQGCTISASWGNATADIPKDLIRARKRVMQQTSYEIPENVRELQRRGLADANGNAIAVTRQQIADEPVSVQKLSIPKECIEFSAEGKSYDWQYEALSDEPTIIKPK